MANNKIKFDLEFNLDQTNIKLAKDAINDLKSSLKKDYHSGIIDTESFKKATASAKELEGVLNSSWNNKLGQLNLDKLDAGIKQSFGSAQNLKTTFENMGPAGTKAFKSIGASIETTGKEIKKTSKLLDSMAESMKNTIKWGISSTIFNSLTRSVQQAWGYAKNLDASLNDIRIVTGDSAEQMERFAKTANKAAKDLGASTLSYTNAALIYYQQGLADAEVQAKASTTLKAANITGQSAQTVSEQLTAVWNGYKVDAAEAELYVDKLQAVAATTASDLQELSTGMSKVASAANLMGVDMDSLNAQLATIISVTKQAPESVGTALKTIYARMGDIEAGLDTEVTLGEYTSKMAEMGINVLDANGKLRDMGDVIEEIGGNWENMTREQQLSLSQTMAGTRQYNNLLSLFDNWDMYTEALNTSANAAGALNEANEIYLESTEAHLQKLSTETQRTFDILFDTDTVNEFLDIFSGVLDKFNNFIEGIGGGTNALIYFGAMFTKIFRKQIANELINASVKVKDFFKTINPKTRSEVKTVSRESVAMQNATHGVNIGSGTAGADAQLAAINKIHKVKQGLTQEEIKQSEENARKIGLLTNQLEIQEEQLKKEKEELEIQKKNNKSSYDAFNKDGGLKSREQIAHDVEVAQTQMSEINPFMEQNQDLSEILVKLEAQEQAQQELNALWERYSQISGEITDKNDLIRYQTLDYTMIFNELTEEEEKQLDIVTKLVVENSNLLNLTEQHEQALMEAVQALKDGKLTAEQYKIILENAKNLQNQGNLFIEEGNAALQVRTDVQESVNNEIREGLNLRKQANAEMAKKGATNQNTQNAISYLMDASMMISSMAGAWETFNDEAATGEQKAHAVGSAIGGVASSAGSIIGTIFGGPAGGMIGSALGSIAGSIGSIIFGLDSVEDKFKSTQEKLQELQEENQKIADEASDKNNKISTLESSVDDYEELSKKAGDYDKNLQNLTEEEKKRYTEVKDALLEYNSSALIGYDAEGNAILAKNDHLRDSIDLLKEEREEFLKTEFIKNRQANFNAKADVISSASQTIEDKTKEREEAVDLTKLLYSDESASLEGTASLERSLRYIAGGLNPLGTGADTITVDGTLYNIDELLKQIQEQGGVLTSEQKELFKTIEANYLAKMEEWYEDTEGSNPSEEHDNLMLNEFTGMLSNIEAEADGHVDKLGVLTDEIEAAQIELNNALTVDTGLLFNAIQYDNQNAAFFQRWEEAGLELSDLIYKVMDSLDYEDLKKKAQEQGKSVEELAYLQAQEYMKGAEEIFNVTGNSDKWLNKIEDANLSNFNSFEEYSKNLREVIFKMVQENVKFFTEMTDVQKQAFMQMFNLSSFDVSTDKDGNLVVNATTQEEFDIVSAGYNIARNAGVQGRMAGVNDYTLGTSWVDYTGTMLTDTFDPNDLLEYEERITAILKDSILENGGDYTKAIEQAKELWDIEKEIIEIKESNDVAIKTAEEELGIEKELFLVTKENIKQKLEEQGIVELTNDELNNLVLQELRINKALKETAKSWDEIKKKINSTDVSDVTEGIADIVKFISKLSGIDSEEITTLFSQEELKEMTPLIEDVFNEVEGSYTELLSRIQLKKADFSFIDKNAVLKDFTEGLQGMNGVTKQYTDIVEGFSRGIEDIIANTDTTFSIDGDNSSFLNSINEALMYTDWSTGQVQEMLKAYGFSANVKEQVVYVSMEAAQSLGKEALWENKSLGKVAIKVPVVEILTKDKGSFGGGLNTSSSGGGGDSGPTENLSDTYDRYHEVNTQLEKINEQLTRQEKIIDRLNGTRKLKGLGKQLALLAQQKSFQEEKLKLLKQERDELKNILKQEDKNNLKNPFSDIEGATNNKTFSLDLKFEDNGHIKNYAETFAKMETFINDMINARNAASEEDKASWDEKIENAKEKYETFKEDVMRYEELINSEIPGMQNEIYETIDQTIETTVAKTEAKLELTFDYDFKATQLQNDLAAVADELERAETAMEKLTGKDKINALTNQSNILTKQATAQNAIIANLENEKTALTKKLNEVFKNDKGFEEGNFREALAARAKAITDLEKKLRKATTEADKQALYQELGVAQGEYEALKQTIENLENIIYKDLPDAQKDLAETADKQIELKIEEQELNLQIKLDFKNARKELNEFKKEILKEDDLTGLSTANQSILSEYFGIDSKAKDQTGKRGYVELQKEKYINALKAYNTIVKGGTDDVYGDNAAKALEDLTASKDELKNLYNEVDALVEENHQNYLKGIDEADEAFAKHLKQYDDLTSSIQYQLDLVDLMKDAMKNENRILANQEEAYKKIHEINKSRRADIKKEIAYWESQKAGIKEGSEEWDKITTNLENAQKELESVTKSSVENVNKIYETSKKLASLRTDNILFGKEKLDSNFDFNKEKENWEKLSNWRKKYLNEVNETFKKDEFIQKVNDAIENTNSLAIQERLNQLKEKELQLLEEKGKVTQKDLDRMNKMLDIELKKIALEEAQKNKSTMRLRRDASGNYSYQYVADQDAIDKAEQDLKKVQNEAINSVENNYGDSKTKLEELISNFQKELEKADKEDFDQIKSNYQEFFTDAISDYETNLANYRKELENQGYSKDKIEQLITEAFPQGELLEDFINNFQTAVHEVKNEEGVITKTLTGFDALFEQVSRPYLDAIEERIKGYEEATGESQVNGELNALTRLSNVVEKTTVDLATSMKGLIETQTGTLNSLKTIFKESNEKLTELSTSVIKVLEWYADLMKKQDNDNQSINIGNAPSLDTGGYTGDWGDSSGRLAILHRKELVLNQEDTLNLLAAMEELKAIKVQKYSNQNLQEEIKIQELIDEAQKNIENNTKGYNLKEACITSFDNKLEISLNTKELADKLDALVQDKANLLSMTSSEFEKAFKNVITDTKTQNFEQKVNITAEFPGVNNSLEIERAFNSLTSKAQRYMVDETAI